MVIGSGVCPKAEKHSIVKQTICRTPFVLPFFISSIALIIPSCNNQNTPPPSTNQWTEANDVSLPDHRERRYYGKDNLHYLANDFEENNDTIVIQYRYDLCLCPKWYVEGTNEPIWLESRKYREFTNYSENELSQKKMKVIGRFYKYPGIPIDLYDKNYLSGKSVPNARIFRIEKKTKMGVQP